MAYTDEFGNIYDDDTLSGDSSSSGSGSIFDNFDYSFGSSGYGFSDANDPYEITNTATNPGEPGYNWKYYSDGTSISPDGKYFYQGDMVYDVNNPDGGTLAKLLGKEGAKALKGLFVNDKGEPNLAGIGSLGMGLYGLLNKDKQGGYNKPVPKMDMVREQIQYNDPNRRPGEAGRQYFTDPRYAAQGDAEALAAAKAASTAQGQGILAAYQPRQEQAPNPYAGKMNLAYSRPGGVATTQAQEMKSADQYQQEQGLPGVLKSAYSIAPVMRAASPAFAASTPPVSGVISNPAEEAMQIRKGTPMPSNPSSPPPGMIQNPEWTERQSRAGETMDMRYVPEYIPSNPSGRVDPPMLPTGLASGGIADAGRYLRGKTDGMADEIETSIDEEQPALLSHGEFVIPADVVSHLGNGNSEAGAEKLYEMMDRIRVARTGTKEQGKEIDPDKFIAAAGGLAAAYAGGGEVQRFNNGGPTTANPTATGAGGVPQDVSRTSTLSPWVGDYVTNALGQGAALAAAPYQAYQGPLTAGASGLQQQAFAGASEMAQAGYTPGQFTGGFNAQTAQQYMNPYLQASLDPQLKELQRQSDIQRMADAGRLTKAGAFGGSRQAIMESEGRRNLLDKQQDVLGQGYKTAYDLGLGQFNKEREADEASRQFGAGFGLKSVAQLADLGTTERGITSEGIAADKAQFEEQRDFAYGMPKYQLGLLSGLPIGANTTAVDQDALSKLQSQLSGLGSNYKLLDAALKELGQKPN